VRQVGYLQVLNRCLGAGIGVLEKIKIVIRAIIHG